MAQKEFQLGNGLRPEQRGLEHPKQPALFREPMPQFSLLAVFHKYLYVTLTATVFYMK